MSKELWRWSACDTVEAIKNKRASSLEFVQSVLDRISATNPKINALTDVYAEAALAEAREKDIMVERGELLGPLHGVPITIKENVDQEGRPTSNGVKAFANTIAPADAPVVKNLRDAGAIIVGQTTTPEFSFRYTTDSPLHGPTFNPWNESTSPGGSSGGAAAALAAGCGPLAHGNDIAGSLRFPAYCCGVSTVRPTFGRIPVFNPSATAERGILAQIMSVQGVIAREVRDVRLGTEVAARFDARDPWCTPAPFRGEPLKSPIKVAVPAELDQLSIDSAVLQALDEAASILSDAGYAVERVKTPEMRDVQRQAMKALMGEVQWTILESVRQNGSETVNGIFDQYFEIFGTASPEEFLTIMSNRTGFMRTWNLFLEEYPLVLTPIVAKSSYHRSEDTSSFDALRELVMERVPYSNGVNFLGLPAAVTPVSLQDNSPVGIQLIGRRFREDLCLDAAEAIENKIGVLSQQLWDAPSSVSPLRDQT